jgi:predicted Fe-Mo cluster-binding NifX family protein
MEIYTEVFMKLAFPTQDGETIFSHFGQARFFKVLEVKDGVVVNAELREKEVHLHHEDEPHHEHGGHHSHAMFDLLKDCEVLIAGGMGTPAFNRAQEQGLEVILTGERSIEKALQAYLQGTLHSDLRRVHAH